MVKSKYAKGFWWSIFVFERKLFRARVYLEYWNDKKWGRVPASEKQIASIKRFMKDFDTENLNKMQATQILNRLFYR